MSVALLFPGQGSQQPRMGADLLDIPEFETLCRSASDATGVDLRHLLLDADEDELRLTQNAQPALCFVEIALAALLQRRGLGAAAAAGHSVAEYSALYAAGSLSAVEALRAVTERGRLMAGAIPAGESSMAAVIGLGPEQVANAIGGIAEVWPANFNTPTQIVVAGRVDALEAAAAAFREAGAKRVVPLNVSAAFHTPLMRPAAQQLRRALDELEWRAPAFPVIANVSAEAYASPRDMPALLERQLYSPVRWGDCVTAMRQLGCDAFVEVGPKRALSGMLRELAPGAYVTSVASAADVERLDLPVASA